MNLSDLAISERYPSYMDFSKVSLVQPMDHCEADRTAWQA
jgi:hypothetical protein